MAKYDSKMKVPHSTFIKLVELLEKKVYRAKVVLVDDEMKLVSIPLTKKISGNRICYEPDAFMINEYFDDDVLRKVSSPRLQMQISEESDAYAVWNVYTFESDGQILTLPTQIDSC